MDRVVYEFVGNHVFSSLTEIIEKRILPTVFVIAIGLNSEGRCTLSDLDINTMKADAQLSGTVRVCHTFLKSLASIVQIAGHFL